MSVEKPARRALTSYQWMRELAHSEVDEEEDRTWLFDLLNQAYTRGTADARRATVYEMHSFIAYAEAKRLIAGEQQGTNQAEWAALSPEAQTKFREDAKRLKAAVRVTRAGGMQIVEGAALLKAEKESGT